LRFKSDSKYLSEFTRANSVTEKSILAKYRANPNILYAEER